MRERAWMGDLAEMSGQDRLAIAEWIGERPETVLVIDALLTGHGRAWVSGHPSWPDAAIVESALVPGEPQGFGSAAALLCLLRQAAGWRCIEVEEDLADEIAPEFERVWGPVTRVVDVIHSLRRPAPSPTHELVRELRATDLTRAPATPDLLPDHHLVTRPADAGRVYVAVDDGVIVGHGSALAAGRTFADVGVQVAASYRGQGIATAAAARACQAVQRARLIPVWGTSSDNLASLRVAAKLGFMEVGRLVFLIPRNS
jgi:GNAT superfamily N-acetyltransferase